MTFNCGRYEAIKLLWLWGVMFCLYARGGRAITMPTVWGNVIAGPVLKGSVKGPWIQPGGF